MWCRFTKTLPNAELPEPCLTDMLTVPDVNLALRDLTECPHSVRVPELASAMQLERKVSTRIAQITRSCTLYCNRVSLVIDRDSVQPAHRSLHKLLSWDT